MLFKKKYLKKWHNSDTFTSKAKFNNLIKRIKINLGYQKRKIKIEWVQKKFLKIFQILYYLFNERNNDFNWLFKVNEKFIFQIYISDS